MSSIADYEAYIRSARYANAKLNSFYTSTSPLAPHEELEKDAFISTKTGNKTKKLTDVKWKDIKLIGETIC